MLLDHFAWAFLPIDTFNAQCMHFLGRITAPVMCYFITEGYHHTHNFKKYLIRMCIFAFISHFAFVYFRTGNFLSITTESMIATLTLCLLTVFIVNSVKINIVNKFLIILFLAYLAKKCDWGATAIIFTLAFELSRGNKKSQLISYTVAAALCIVIPLIETLLTSTYFFSIKVYTLGVFLPIPLLLLYNGDKGGGKYSKWVFYIFYPLHLLILGFVSYNY